MLLRVAAVLMLLGIFLVDALSKLEGAVAVLYVVAVLLVAPTARRGDIIAIALVAIGLTIAAYAGTHGLHHVGAQTLRALVSLAAIGITALLALRIQSAMLALASQATLLDLSHDMIFVRDRAGRITFWNRTAQDIYGWPAGQALGRIADELLQTRYPQPREQVEALLLAEGHWSGILEQRTRTGAALVLDSRWVLQRDAAGRPLDVMETHTDITGRRAADAALAKSERRYRRMFDSTRIGVVQQDWGAVRAALQALGAADADALAVALDRQPGLLERLRGMIRLEDANPAFMAMITAGDGGPAPQSLDQVLAQTDRTFARSLAAFIGGEAFYEDETEILAADGRRVPVIFTLTFSPEEGSEHCVLAFVVDNTERRHAQDALQLAQAELAHAARVATLGELTASIAHEVNQPLMAVVTNGEAGLRWLRRDVPDLPEVEQALVRSVAEGSRAGEIVMRIRAFLSKSPPQHDRLDAAWLIDEAARLVAHQLAREDVVLRVHAAPDLPPILGDRIRLQQVLVNLMINASQAMAGQAGPRQLSVSATAPMPGRLAIAVSDTGPGISAEHAGRLFEPFFTTKREGMGMGLAIARTIAQAHGGDLSVASLPGQGATFTLTLDLSPSGDPA